MSQILDEGPIERIYKAITNNMLAMLMYRFKELVKSDDKLVFVQIIKVWVVIIL